MRNWEQLEMIPWSEWGIFKNMLQDVEHQLFLAIQWNLEILKKIAIDFTVAMQSATEYYGKRDTPRYEVVDFVDKLKAYKKKGWFILFEWWFFPGTRDSKWWPVTEIALVGDKLKVSYVQYDDPNPQKIYTHDELKKLQEAWPVVHDEIKFSRLFDVEGAWDWFNFQCWM